MTANRAKGVQQLSAEKQSRTAPALERAAIHLIERDAATGDFRLGIPFVARPGELECREVINEARAI